MGAANLDDVIKLHPLLLQRCMELPKARQEPGLNLHGDSNVHGRGESVIGALTSVDVIVGMDG